MLLFLLLACASEPAPTPAPTPGEPTRSAPAPAVAAPQPVVVLISWDTTRADALSPYAAEQPWHPERPSAPQPATPVAQGLADAGLRFSWALAHAPTTLSSHVSMMSGLDPHGHGVPRNGFPVSPELPLLAERFRDAGWDTLAVVGGSPLERAMGLDRGFRIYDDAVSTHVRKRFEDPADRVTARALSAVDGRFADRPLFLFVHYFDAHSPWDSAPDAVQQRFVDDLSLALEEPGPLVQKARAGTLSPEESDRARGLYLAEVAWVDQQTGVLLEGLSARGLLDDALVVLVGDHGEALDEPGLLPYGHGLDVDLPAIHVPWILRGSGRFAVPAGAVVPDPVRLMDLPPTVLALAGLDPALGEGRDLAVTWATPQPPPSPPSFAEATKPVRHETAGAWNNLSLERSVVHDGLLLTLAPAQQTGPQAFRLAPGQPEVKVEPEARQALLDLLAAWDARAPAHREADLAPATRAALEALGYLDE